MDQDDDVERLFSWLKTPDLRYREFAGEREVADAVATWPALRRAAAETARSEGAEGPGSVAQGSSEPVFHPVPEPPETRRELPPIMSPAADAAGDVPWAEEATPSPPAAPARAAARPEPPPARVTSSAAREPRAVSPGSRETIFGGTYRGFEERAERAPEPAPAAPAEGGDRSLNAVFSRLSRPAARYREEQRTRSPGPGLGPVFRRLR